MTGANFASGRPTFTTPCAWCRMLPSERLNDLTAGMGRTISDAVYRMVKNDMPMDAATRGRSRSVPENLSVRARRRSVAT